MGKQNWKSGSASGGGHVPSHKQKIDHGREYPAREYPAEYELQVPVEKKGAARKAVNRQIPNSARPEKK